MPRVIDQFDLEAEAEGNAVLRHAQQAGLKRPKGKKTGAMAKAIRAAINKQEVRVLRKHMEPNK